MITKSRRNLLLIIGFAIIGILAFRASGKAALRNAMTVYESEAGPLKMTSYAPEEVEKRSNIGQWLKAGIPLVDMKGEERGFLRKFIQENPMKINDPTIKRIEELIQRNEFPLQILDKSLPLKKSDLGLRYSDNIELAIPNLLEYMQASFLLGAKWRLELQKQELAAAAQTAFLQERIASALTHEPIVICGLIGHVAEKDFYEFLHRTIDTTDQTLLQTEIEYLKHLKEMATPIDRVIAADGAAVYSSLSSEFLSNDYFDADASPASGSFPASQRISLETSYFFNRSYFLANLLGTYTDLMKYARTPVANHADDQIDQSWVSKMFFSSNVNLLIRRYQGQDAARSLAITAVTLRLQALRDGVYKKPQTLPKSALSGEIAEYRALPDGGIELTYPQTLQIWNQKFPKTPPERPRLQWRLPPL